MTLYLVAFLGIIAHFGMLFDSARRKPDFTWELFIINNAAMFLLSFIISGLIVYQYNIAIDDAKEAVRLFFDKYSFAVIIIAFLVGYNAGDIWHRINKMFRKKTNIDQTPEEDDD